MAVFHFLTQRRRGVRSAPFCLLLLTLGLPGCVATKRDVRTLQDELAAMRVRQDSLERVANRQSRMLQDSIRASAELLRTIRGQLTNDIRNVQELLLTVQQLMGQNEQRLAQMRDQMEQQRQAAAPAATPPPATSTGQGNFDEMYAAGMARLKDSPATARAIFQQTLADHPRHERAPEVQYYIGETYYEEGNFAQAYREYELVASSYPDSRRAPGALYRAGVIAQERRENQKAREYFTRVRTNYPNTDEARQAAQALARLPR